MNNKSSYYKYNSSILILFISLLFSSTIKAQAEENSAENEHIEPTEIRITGALTPLGLDRIGKPVSIFTHQELQERSEPTIGELLATAPGVSSSYFGPGASRPIIRGQSKERVRILENGLESGDVSKVSDDHAVSIDPLTIQRVDVLRGPSTLLYGGSAIGGVVNMIDESIAEENIGRAITGEMDLRKGNSADDELSGALSLSGQQNTINWHFSGFYRETDDIKIPRFPESKRLRQGEAPNNHGHHHILKHDHDHEHHEDEHDHHDEHEEAIRGKLPNSDTLSKGFKVSASHVWDRGFLGLALRINSSRYGVPGGHSHGEDDDEHDHHHNLQKGQQHLRSGSHGHDDEIRIDLDQIRLESRGEVRLDDDFFKRIRFGMAYSDYRHKELEGDEVGTKFENNTFEGRVEVMHKHADDFEGGFGTQINYEDFKASGEEAFVPPSETFSPALFAVEDYKISERLILQLGGRYEYSHVSPRDLDSENFHLLSASTGLVRSLDADNNYSLGLTLAYSERAPNATELFANGPHLATQTFEIGDASLKKEKSAGSELILRKNSGRLTGSSGVFWQHYFDYINLSPTAGMDDGLPVFLYDLERARFWGFESQANYDLFTDAVHNLALYGQIDYVRGQNLSDSDPLPRITPLRGKTGVKYSYEQASAYVEGIFVDSQKRTADFELPTDSYAMLNVGLAYQIPVDDRNTYELYARGTNLTDEEARVHTSFLKDVAPLKGRAFLAGLRVRF